jgi:Tetratricopeptide repeat
MPRLLSDLLAMTAQHPKHSSIAWISRFLGVSLCAIVVGCSTTPPPTTSGNAPAPYLGGYGPTDPPRMSTNPNPETGNNQLSESIAVPFLSFLIIEPDPVMKNAIPTHIEKLIKERKYPDAIKAIDAALVKTPRNVQLRFIKARLQVELRDVNAARATWIEITQQFPELPEPYNNLAALAANQGQWIEARDYLELALKLRPDYVLAQGNLADVYLRLADRYYSSASKLQPSQREYGQRARAIKEILNPPPPKPSNRPNSPISKP